MIKRLFRYLALAAAAIMLWACIPFSHAGAQIDSTVRVWLKRLKVEDTLHIEVCGAYMLEGGSMTFADGSEIIIALRGDQLVLHSGGIAAVMGDRMKLVRCHAPGPSSLKLNGSDGRYEGDLLLDIAEGVIRPVLHIDVEDYLLGVVPYEMGDSFPLEALKAQAIAARTYALRKSGSNIDYDVEDTTNDQAYRGRSDSSPLSEQAVRETEGLCGAYKGKLATCYYSASNGGQTELGQHVWPVDDPDAYAYMDMRDDPFDFENEASVVKRFTLAKRPGEKGVGAALHSALVQAMAEQLEDLGVQADDNLVRFDEILSVEAMQPKYDAPSRLMTQLKLEVRVSVRDYTYKAPAARQNEEMTPEPQATPSPSPVPTATPAFSPYRKIRESFTVVLPIFTDAEKAMGLSINVYQNELITVTDIGSAFMIESRRFGHGVGMSQRGAQQMAGKYGLNYQQILSFYYPTMDIMSFSGEKIPLPTIDVELMATPAPTASPTPRPTLMPVTKNGLPKGAYIAVVSNIDDDSSLNLRQEPTLSSDVLRRLYKHQELIVLKTRSDGWSHVKTDVIEGYVRSEYLQTAGE